MKRPVQILIFVLWIATSLSAWSADVPTADKSGKDTNDSKTRSTKMKKSKESKAGSVSGETEKGNQEDLNLEAKLTYPELEVTPRASDRLEIEAKRERQRAWSTHLPLQFSALATLYAGMNVDGQADLSADEKDKFSSQKSLAVGVGVGWLALTGLMATSYRPYRTGLSEISKLPKGTDREQLTRERIAEESMNAPASLATKLVYFSAISNLAASALLFKDANADSRKTVAFAMVSAFAPFLFEYRWSEVANQHREYKKKIYGPLANVILVPTPDLHGPGLGVLWTF